MSSFWGDDGNDVCGDDADADGVDMVLVRLVTRYCAHKSFTHIPKLPGGGASIIISLEF